MAEGRMIKKRLSKSEKFAALKTDGARLLYCLIMPHTDVKGRHEAEPIVIKGQIAPYIKTFTLRNIQIYLEDLYRVGLITLYKVNNIQYLEVIRFEDFNRIDHTKEAKSNIPTPTKETLLQSNSRVTPAEVNISLSKVNISKDTATPPNGVSLKLKELLNTVYKDINIYSLVNKLKKDLNWAAGKDFPNEVLIGVCEQYLKDKDNIKGEWSWFVSVIKAESTKYYAAQSVKEGEDWKKMPVAKSIKEIMAGAMTAKQVGI